MLAMKSVRLVEAELADIGDARAVHGHREHLGLEALAVAHRARHLAQVALHALALGVGLGLEVLALEVRHHALVAGGVLHVTAIAVAPADGDLEVLAVQHGVLLLVAERAPGIGELEPEVVRQPIQQLLEVVVQALARRWSTAGWRPRRC